MKREIISILIVLALIIGVVVGYYGNSPKTTTITATYTLNQTKTETKVSNYTVTTTAFSVDNSSNLVGVEVMRCALTVYNIVGGNTTDSTSPQLYNTTTSLTQTVGFVSTTTGSSSTFNGRVGVWTVTACTVVSNSS